MKTVSKLIADDANPLRSRLRLWFEDRHSADDRNRTYDCVPGTGQRDCWWSCLHLDREWQQLRQ